MEGVSYIFTHPPDKIKKKKLLNSSSLGVVFPVEGWYLTYPGDNGHVLSEFCNIHHRRVVSSGG